jgi:hypothetical protein
MQTLKDILSNYGYLNSAQLAWEAIQRIKKVEADDIDYCREVFLTGKDCENLRVALHISP